MSEIPLTAHGNNANIVFHVLDPEKMRKAGFFVANTRWVYSRKLCDSIIFRASVAMSRPHDWEIDILDDDFGHPYDYQYMLNKTPTFSYALKIQKKVEQHMTHLAECGIVTGHNPGDYI